MCYCCSRCAQWVVSGPRTSTDTGHWGCPAGVHLGTPAHLAGPAGRTLTITSTTTPTARITLISLTMIQLTGPISLTLTATTLFTPAVRLPAVKRQQVNFFRKRIVAQVAQVSAGRTLFLSHNQQYQSIERNLNHWLKQGKIAHWPHHPSLLKAVALVPLRLLSDTSTFRWV